MQLMAECRLVGAGAQTLLKRAATELDTIVEDLLKQIRENRVVAVLKSTAEFVMPWTGGGEYPGDRVNLPAARAIILLAQACALRNGYQGCHPALKEPFSRISTTSVPPFWTDVVNEALNRCTAKIGRLYIRVSSDASLLEITLAGTHKMSLSPLGSSIISAQWVMFLVRECMMAENGRLPWYSGQVIVEGHLLKWAAFADQIR